MTTNPITEPKMAIHSELIVPFQVTYLRQMFRNSAARSSTTGN
jgi:hypothetical protein